MEEFALIKSRVNLNRVNLGIVLISDLTVVILYPHASRIPFPKFNKNKRSRLWGTISQIGRRGGLHVEG